MSVYNHRPSTVNLNQLVTNIPIRRKAADQLERDKFEWNQWQSASKAINSAESPAKEKHVRTLILGTFRLEGARLFWSMMTRLQLESHPIVCWKFCYVIHRLLRDGHKHVVNDSIPLAPYFEQLGKFWSALRQSYGVMTYRYCRLMISKLTFHERNPLFHGNLSIGEQNDIRRLLNDNLDGYFQLCIELLDYMEELLGLVEVIFTSLDQTRANSMTAAGQCRLHPLMLCIQDSSVLYDYIVKVLFKLHENLPGDTLQGHRTRLIEQFRRLKRFYEHASTLQYFKDLIKVPTLPEHPPNFKLKDDIKNYQTPVAIVHTPPPEPTNDTDSILIDTSDDARDLASAFPTNDDWPPNGHTIDRSKEIADLEQRLLKCDAMLRENRSETEELHRRIAAKDTELATERNHRLQLEDQLRQELDNHRRTEEMHTLEKKGNSDEKFNKLLEAYNKLREEHIVVLRREGEVKKQLANLNQEYTALKDAHKKMEEEFQRFKTDHDQLKNQKQEEVNQEIIQLRQTNDELQERILALTNERNDFQTTTVASAERIKEIEHVKQSVENRYKELESEKSSINNRLEADKAEFERRSKEAEHDREDLLNKNREHEENLIDLCHEKEELEHKILDLENATREWAQKYVTTTDNQKLMQNNHANMTSNLKQQYKYSILTHCINQMHDGIERAKDVELLSCKSGAEYLLSKLRMAVNSTKATQDLWKKQAADESSTLPFLNECISLANNMTDIVIHGKATSNLIQDIDQSAVLADHCRDVTLQCIDLFTTYQTPSNSVDFDKQSSELIRRLNSLIDRTTTLLPKGSDISKEELGDLVEKELQSTHETIDNAVRQLEALMAKSREQDTGIKCEVNGQILDSCGKLMQTIKILIIKARDLQKEIVAQGRGTASAREFYTKNHKWTEGLVSAAKNVGVNAKVLIESADHLLSGNGKFEEIIACSQEIAASTAQLVAASNVKADRASKNREGLSQASKAVNTSTAQVVATAKNCAAIIEEKSTMDFSTLSLHQTKRKEMDAQVKVLELEKALEQAKQLLYTLRKQHYQMAGEDAGWSQEAISNLDAAKNPHN